MPSSRAILSDIADLKLDPSKAYTTVKASGRLSASTPIAVLSTSVEEQQSPVVNTPSVEQLSPSPVDVVLQSGSVQDVLSQDVKEEVQIVQPKVDDVKKKDDKKKELDKKKDKKAKSSDEVEPTVISDSALD